MLISCKCLNFIASSGSQQFNSQHQQQQQQQQLQLQLQLQLQKSSSSTNNAAVETADGRTAAVNDGSVSPSSSSSAVAVTPNAAATTNGVSNSNNAIATALMHIFLQKYPRNFVFYSQFMEFFKQAIGPIPDLTINAINQRDLIYSVTIDLPNPSRVGGFQTWQLSLCINCNVALCAKKLQAPAASPTASTALPQIPQFLVNQMLITTNEELAHRRADKSFSDTFGVRIIDHPELANGGDSSNALNAGNVGGNNPSTTPAPLATFTIGSLSSSSSITQMPIDSKQLRLRQLHAHMQQRLQREIAETNERIQRYTEQQFALLKSFREKSEQEYELLLRLVQRVPEQIIELMDRLPPMLEVSAGAVNYLGARRRNTIGSRRDLNSHAATAPTTPTTPSTQPPTFLALPYSISSKSNSASESATTPASAMDTNQAAKPVSSSAAATVAGARSSTPAAANNSSNTSTLLTSALNRKMSNFDTPPATPEATPMSVGNSPTFKQQQPQPQATAVATVATQAAAGFGLRLGQSSFQQQFPTPSVETADDCLFEFDGFEDVQQQQSQPMQAASYANNLYQHQQQQQQQQQHQTMQQPTLPYQQRHQILQMHMQQHQLQRMQHQHENNMSDVDESDAAEEAEDALDLDSSLPIPMNRPLRHIVQQDSAQQRMNFGKSLPIEIANSPMAAGRSYIDDSEEEVLDNTVDIAASIKALAKSVHGEAVFGDLPRPRLRSEI